MANAIILIDLLLFSKLSCFVFVFDRIYGFVFIFDHSL
jgi:hypothetical protein